MGLCAYWKKEAWNSMPSLCLLNGSTSGCTEQTTPYLMKQEEEEEEEK